MKKKNNDAKRKNNSGTRIPKDVQESIPYRSVYPNGTIEDYDGNFSRSYLLQDTNFTTEDEEKRQSMFLEYERLLNCVSTGMTAQITIFNRNIDADVIRNNILMKPQSDGLNNLREEWNDLFLYKMTEGKNNLDKQKIFTVSAPADNILLANDILNNVDVSVNKIVKSITREETKPMTIEERLDTLYNIYNCGTDFSFKKKIEPISKNGHIDFEKLSKHGIQSKDLIGPDSMSFAPNHITFGNASGDVVVGCFYLDHLPNMLTTNILNDLSNLSCNMITSVTYSPMESSDAMKLIKNQNTAINAQIVTIQKQNQGIGATPAELEHASQAASELISDVLSRDQKIFKTQVIIAILANSVEDLTNQTKALRSVADAHSCQLRQMSYQEENAFNTALPLGQVQIPINRVLTTESASVFIPFTVQELYQKNGLWYGQNAISHNMIRYDRKSAANYNGVIVGKPGSGKSFFSKEEIAQVLLNSDDRVIIIDPEGEYSLLGKEFGATIVNIDLNSNLCINPLDLDMQDENPVATKCDYIMSLVEAMVGGEGILSPLDKNLIQRVGAQIYRPYYEHMKERLKRGITIDREAMPTLQDFYEGLLKQREPEAQILAASIENYCVGNYDIFAHRTNVNTNARVIVYNLKNLLGGLKELAMQVCMSDSWNNIISNGRKGIYTRIYIDEFHLFTKTVTSARNMQSIYKRARKWKGIPTAITQNIGDLLVNDEATAIVNNSNFVVMMDQSPMDREILADMYQISQELREYITNKGFGTGLIYNGRTIVPFENSFTEETRMYTIMNSKDMQLQE